MYFSCSIFSLRPSFVTWCRVASGFQILIVLVLPLTLVSVFLYHPTKMFSRPYICRIVNMLHIKNLVRAIGIFLCRNFQTPELRKVCEWVGTGCRFCRRCAGQACGIIRQLADHRCTLGISRCGYAMCSRIIQDISEPSFQHLSFGVHFRVILVLPPLYKKGVHLRLGSSRRNLFFVENIRFSCHLVSVYLYQQLHCCVSGEIQHFSV